MGEGERREGEMGEGERVEVSERAGGGREEEA